jgi:hypothetical protein
MKDRAPAEHLAFDRVFPGVPQLACLFLIQQDIQRCVNCPVQNLKKGTRELVYNTLYFKMVLSPTEEAMEAAYKAAMCNAAIPKVAQKYIAKYHKDKTELFKCCR